MAFCEQCGAQVGNDLEERFCPGCGACQPEDIPAAAVAVSAPSGVWDQTAAYVATLCDDPRARLAAVYAGALLLLTLAARFGGFETALLLLPLTIGVVVSLTKPRGAPCSIARFESWATGAHERARTKQTRMSRWINRPYLGGIALLKTWTNRIDDERIKCGVRVASYLYFSGLFVLAILVAAYAALMIVIALVLLFVMLWIITEFALSDSTSSSISRGRSASRVFGTSVMRNGLFWNTPTGVGINERGEVVKEGILFDTPTGMKINPDGQFMRKGTVFDTPARYKLDEDGRLVKEGLVFDTPSGFRLDDDGDIVREGVLFDEETGVRLDKK